MNLLANNFFQFHFLTFSRSHILLFLLLVSCTRSVSVVDEPLSKSVKWMWEQQSEDGGWHSNTHAVLRDGKVLTPYILYYLLHVPDEVYPVDNTQLEKGLNFISTQLD